MSISETTSNALSVLFPEQQAAGPESETGSDEEKKDTPRQNGIVARDFKTSGFDLDVQISPEQVVETARIMFSLGYYLESITGVDWIKEEQLEVVYDFSRYDSDRCRVAIRLRLPRTDPHLPTITRIYTGANWHERETHDFFGIVFDGHPNLIPLLLPEDADFHPLLKDFSA